MIKTSKQLKDLVGNRAHGDSAKSMLFLRNYAMERFLERLSASKYRNCFILKGGMLISAMVGIDSRATMDIDTTLRNYPLNCESVEQIVRQIADVEIDDKISFVIKKTEEIMEDSEYQGVRLSLDAYLDKTRIPLKIDISTGDVITPCEISFSYQLMFENRTIPLLAYPPETVLAEKLETILSRGEANTRLRDFYDVYILQREDFVVTPDALCHALLATYRKRGHEDLLHTYASILNEVRQSGADTRDDAHPVFSDYGYNCFHLFLLPSGTAACARPPDCQMWELYLVICCHPAVQQVEEVGLGLLMQGMHGVIIQRFPAFKLGIQGVIHAVERLTDLQMQQARNLSHQRLQNGRDQFHGLGLVNALFQGVQYDMLYHNYPPYTSF